jgi:hypothetical protein
VKENSDFCFGDVKVCNTKNPPEKQMSSKEIYQSESDEPVLYRTQGGNHSAPKLNYNEPWFQNALKAAFSNSSNYTFRFLAGEANFTSLLVQESKDETQAGIRASFRGADFTGRFELSWNPEKREWRGTGSYSREGNNEHNSSVSVTTVSGFQNDGSCVLVWHLAQGVEKQCAIVRK